MAIAAAAQLLKRSQVEFLHQVVAPALASEREYGVPACITLAQSIIESAARVKGAWTWGGSSLFRLYNNPFGIKAAHHIGSEPYQEHAAKTQELVGGKLEDQEAEFERYPTLIDAFHAHAMLLSRLSRYQPAMAVASDWQKFAAEIMKCGYSTDRPGLCREVGCVHYAAKLVKLVDDYHLNDLYALACYAVGQDPGQEKSVSGQLSREPKVEERKN